MNGHSLFSRFHPSGGTTGGRFKVGMSPRSTTASGNHSQISPTHESVNKKYHLNADTEVARASEPCTCPRVLLSSQLPDKI